MLEIKKVSKQYKTGDLVQNALSSVSLEFRSNEFVAILGPSGSGKTTLLNIIGATLLSTVFPQNNTQAATGILTETIPSGSFFRVTI